MILKSLLCLNHAWRKAPNVDQLWRCKGKTKWLCTKCGKVSWRNNVDPPIRESLDNGSRETPARGKDSSGERAVRSL